VIFGDREGCPRDPDRLRKRVWRPALAAAGLRHVTLYSLRHFFASMLIQPGESLKYVSAQLGHTSIQITVDRYGHLLPEERTSARRLEARPFVGGGDGPRGVSESARVSRTRHTWRIQQEYGGRPGSSNRPESRARRTHVDSGGIRRKMSGTGCLPAAPAPGLAAHQPLRRGSETAFTSAVPEAPERETR
jgi:hypothetical protein